MAAYKTIILELLQEQYPALHERLRSGRTLLSEMDDYAASLKRHHESWMDRLSTAKPHRDQTQVESQALELALADIQDDLRSRSAPPDTAHDPLSLDAGMSFLRRHTPPA